MGMVQCIDISSEISDDSEAVTSSDGGVQPARYLRSSRSDDSDKEKKPMKCKRLDLMGLSLDPMSSQEEITAVIPLSKRRKVTSVKVKLEEDVASPTFLTLPSTSSTTYFASPNMSMLQSGTKKKKKRIPYTLVEASKGNKCPTEGCDGIGHTTGMYAMHFAVSGCPLAHGKTAEECKARRDELNRLRSQSMPEEGEEEEEGAAGGRDLGDRPLWRGHRSVLGGTVVGGGSGNAQTMMPYSKKITSQVRIHQLPSSLPPLSLSCSSARLSSPIFLCGHCKYLVFIRRSIPLEIPPPWGSSHRKWHASRSSMGCWSTPSPWAAYVGMSRSWTASLPLWTSIFSEKLSS